MTLNIRAHTSRRCRRGNAGVGFQCSACAYTAPSCSFFPSFLTVPDTGSINVTLDSSPMQKRLFGQTTLHTVKPGGEPNARETHISRRCRTERRAGSTASTAATCTATLCSKAHCSPTCHNIEQQASRCRVRRIFCAVLRNFEEQSKNQSVLQDRNTCRWYAFQHSACTASSRLILLSSHYCGTLGRQTRPRNASVVLHSFCCSNRRCTTKKRAGDTDPAQGVQGPCLHVNSRCSTFFLHQGISLVNET